MPIIFDEDFDAREYFKDPVHVNELHADLKSPDKKVRFRAVVLVRKGSVRECIDDVFALLWDEVELCREAVKTLCELGADKYVDYLHALLSPGINEEIRETVAGYLGNLKNPGSLLVLLPYVNDPHPPFREVVLRSIGRLAGFAKNTPHESIVVATLFRGLQDPNDVIREWSAYGLEILEVRAIPDNVFPTIIEALHSKDYGLFSAIMRVIEKSGDRRFIPYLLELLDPARSDPSALARLIETLSKYPDPDIGVHFIPFLAHDYDNVVRAACLAIGNLATPAGFQPLVNLFQTSPSSEIRNHALWGIARFENVEGQAIITKALDDPDPNIRDAAKTALVNFFSLKVVDIIFARIVPLDPGNYNLVKFFLEVLFTSDLESKSPQFLKDLDIATLSIANALKLEGGSQWLLKNLVAAIQKSNYPDKESLLRKI